MFYPDFKGCRNFGRMSDQLQMAVQLWKECAPSFKKRDFKYSQKMPENLPSVRSTGFKPHSPSTGIYFMPEIDGLLKFSLFIFGLISF